MHQENGNIIVVDSVTIMPKGWRNFAGRPTSVNPAGGNRFFNCEIRDPMDAEFLASKGVKIIQEDRYRPDDPDKWRFEIKLSYQFGPVPIHVRNMDGSETMYSEGEVHNLDYIGIKNTAVVAFALSHWKKGHDEGNTAYLRSAAFELWAGDPLEGIWKPTMDMETLTY